MSFVKNFLVIRNVDFVLVFFKDYISYNAIKNFLYDKFTYFVNNYRFSEAYIQGIWDGKKKLYKINYDKGILKIIIPIGLLDDFINFLNKSGLINRFSIIDASIEKYSGFNSKLEYIGLELRDYQKEAVESLLKKRYGIISLPTGSGKMLVAVYLFYLLKEKGVIVLRNIESILQTKREFESNVSGFKIGLFYSNEKSIEGADVVLTTFSSLYFSIIQKNELFKFLKTEANTVLFDESHHISDNTYKEAINFYKPYRIYGMTGTAYRNDNADLELKAMFGNLVYKVDISTLQERDFLAKSVINFIEIDQVKFDRESFILDFPEIRTSGYLNIYTVDAAMAYRMGVVYNLKRVEVIKSILEYFQGKKILILVKFTYHGKYYSRIFGYDFVNGRSRKIERNKYFDMFINDSNYNVLIASTIYDESINIPNLEVVINTTGHSSSIAQIQRHGRGIRKTENKDKFVFIDFFDMFDKRAIKHSRARITAMKKEGLTVNVFHSIEEFLRNLDNLVIKEV